ncbi:MAG TPA: hypothetical protein VHK24_05835 [Steroidobacter sp.]|jgi:acetamidase/formamidase|nr:hypothetical protein [Steroidobacter sp.]
MTAEFLPGIVIPLRPFFGSMGVAPSATVMPRRAMVKWIKPRSKRRCVAAYA